MIRRRFSGKTDEDVIDGRAGVHSVDKLWVYAMATIVGLIDITLVLSWSVTHFPKPHSHRHAFVIVLHVRTTVIAGLPGCACHEKR